MHPLATELASSGSAVRSTLAVPSLVDSTIAIAGLLVQAAKRIQMFGLQEKSAWCSSQCVDK